ncbi:MAG: hypothetical protein ACI8PZ_007502, partial [Myxococcota bacterium]
MTDVGARLEGVFARHAPSVLAEAQRDSFDQLVHGAPPGVVRARGRVLASRVRDWLAAQGRTREATAVTRGLLRSYIDESG